MAPVNEARFRMSLGDWDKQRRQFSFDAAVITAANHDAKKSDHDDLVAAIMDVTLGTLDFEEFVADRESIRPMLWPAVAAAQVNVEWVFSYVDDVTGSPFNVRIPTADITDTTLFAAGSHLWDPTDAKWVTLQAAFETYITGPLTGNAVSLSQVAFLQ